MSARHLSRSIVLQTLYEWDFLHNFVNGDSATEQVKKEDHFDRLLNRNIKELAAGVDDATFILELANGIKNKKQEIDKIIEVVGTSKKSWEDAARNAVEAAGKTVKDLRVAEIVRLDMTVDEGKVINFRARVNLSFKYHGE